MSNSLVAGNLLRPDILYAFLKIRIDGDTRKKKAIGAKRHYKGDYLDLKATLFE
jgi:hypothetical protein